MARAQRDVVALGIAIAAIILFVATGGSALPEVVSALRGIGDGPDSILASALLLNIALIIFGWRRYRELQTEIEVRRTAELEARELAHTDPLTGCLNRRSLAPAADAIIASSTEGRRATALLMIDLDNFKQINDLYGHLAGDTVLISAASRIQDVLPTGALLARLGGDEFACVVPYDETRPQTIDRMAEKLIAAVSQPVELAGHMAQTTVSVGIAGASDGMDDVPGGASLEGSENSKAQILMHRADIAMYNAKKRGKDRYFWFEEPMEYELRHRNELELGIRRGIALGEFVPYYEQQVDLNTGELAGFEMLARWNSPDHGIVNPDIFIPIAEEIGVIGDLSEQLIAQAFDDARSWAPHLTLSVNISPQQMSDPWFSQKLLKLITEKNFPPKRLEIEITESCLHENLATVKAMITGLRNQGVHVSLDDFGTGYASLTQLQSLPFDGLKIDRSFVRDLSENGHSSKIINAIIELGDGMALPITAEGIEDEKVLALLKGLGPLKGQGYYYGRPETAQQVVSRLKRDGLLRTPTPPVRDLDFDTGTDMHGAELPRQTG